MHPCETLLVLRPGASLLLLEGACAVEGLVWTVPRKPTLLQGQWPSWKKHVLEQLHFSPHSVCTVTWLLGMSSWLKEKLWRSVTLGWLETSCMIPTMSPRAVYVLNLCSSALTEMKIVSFKCYFMFLPFSVGYSNWPLAWMLLRTIYLQIINSCNFYNSVLKLKSMTYSDLGQQCQILHHTFNHLLPGYLPVMKLIQLWFS